MTALLGWNLLPIGLALTALLLMALRARALLFHAALDGRAFAEALAARLSASDLAGARALARRLRPAWAAELAFRAAGADASERAFVLDEARAEFAHAALRGLLALRTLGRLSLPLALAISIVELAHGFDASQELAPDRVAGVSAALARGLFACVTGLCTALACQWSANVFARAARQRLGEIELASQSFNRAIN